MAFLRLGHLLRVEVRQRRRDVEAPVASARRAPGQRKRGEEPARRHRRPGRVQAGTHRDLARRARLPRRGVKPGAADNPKREPVDVFLEQGARPDEAVVEERDQLGGEHLGEAVAACSAGGVRRHRARSYAACRRR